MQRAIGTAAKCFSTSQSCDSCKIEGLEPRRLFAAHPVLLQDSDGAMSPSVTRLNLPAAVVSGTPATGSGVVHISNHGIGAEDVTTVQLLISPDGLSEDASPLATRSVNVPVKAGRSTNISVPIHSIPSTTAGDYYILARTTDSGQTSVDSVVFSRKIHIAAPFVALTATATAVHPNVFGTKAHAFSGTITVTNTGNVDATGTMTVTADGFNYNYPLGVIGANEYQFAAHIKAHKPQKFVVHDQYLGQGSVPSGVFKLDLIITLDGATDEIAAPGSYTVT